MYDIELLEINGLPVPHRVYPIPGDGACLFSALSYAMYGCVSHSPRVRAEIVDHASRNWERLHIYSMNRECQPYQSLDEYVSNMSRPYTYGTTFELEVAKEIYPFQFQLYINRVLQTGNTYGNAPVVKRLKFTGPITEGHFSVYEQCSLNSSNLTTPMDVDDPVLCSTQNSNPSTPKTKRKRRARFTDATRKKQLKEASRVYKENHPSSNYIAVAKYTQNNPEINRASVAKYTQNHPEINRKSVAKYTQNNPGVNRSSVSKYMKKNPEVSRKTSYRNDPTGEKRQTRRLLIWKTIENSGFNYNPELNYETEKSVLLGPMANICKFCKAKKWKDEPPGICCNNGKVKLPHIEKYPEPLHSLLTYQHAESEHFLANTRMYNSCFQMTSFGAKDIKIGNFMPTFKIQGQVYHRIGSLMPVPEQQPAFLQIYFVGDKNTERDIRCGNFPNVKQELVMPLQELLHTNNKYIRDLKTAIESVPDDQQHFQVVIDANRKPHGEHRGRYNDPTTDEVAVLIVGQEFDKRDIVLHSRNSTLQRISETHRAYDALQYPIMFCRGEDGYCINIPQCDPINQNSLKKTVSAVDFYSYRIMDREEDNSYILLFRNLLNQFLVDMYAKIESERLLFIRTNQKKLRSEEYVHLKDSMSKADCNLSELGKMCVLPSTFTGGPRYMHERTQDAMTYVRHFGCPDLFITFTCNPKWPEIIQQLKQGQKPQDRHEMVARIFHLKVKKMINLLTKGCLFGPSRCHMYSVEWQKRGLPHVHILLWLEEKIRPESIDKVIHAEIPEKDTDPILHDIVRLNMIHGPCGPLNSRSPCMVDGACSKKYPRPLLKETQTGEDGYPLYRRRSATDGGHTVKINGIDIDNRWIVPYNPVLSRIFSAHINVEYCNSVKSIKYICKYVNKGSDQATFTIGDFDEISRYESGRYISSSEAAWRIFCFPIHERYPSVMHLAVHLENGQRVYFNEYNVQDMISCPKNTTLLAFFELCKSDEFASKLFYCDVPGYYVWKGNKFCRRKQGKPVPGYPGVKKDQTLGRVYTVHPGNAECYYLRLLLHTIPGPQSFSHLKTVAGVTHPTFQAACKALGLLEDDANWDHTLEEASCTDSPQRIRELFAIMLVFCQVSDPVLLWEKHRDSLAEDLQRQVQKDQNLNCKPDSIMEVVYNKCLIIIEDLVLGVSGHHLRKFGLPSPSRDENALDLDREYLREISYDITMVSKQVADNVPKLNNEQRLIYSKIIECTASDIGQLFFLDAPGGTGKTYLINLLLSKVRSERNVAIAVASSGIAATLLDGGRTAHSAFKLPLNLSHSHSALCNISKQSGTARVLREAKLIVWDECTMAHKGGIEALDRILKDLKSNNKLMGGVTVLLAGDFRQTLPVIPRGTRADEVNACLKSSNLWPKVQTLSLTTNLRVYLQNDLKASEFSRILLDIGDGRIAECDGKITIPDQLCKIVNNMESLIERIYPNICNISTNDYSWLRERAILTPTNDTANSINAALMDKLPTHQMRYESVDSVIELDDAVHYPVEFLNTLNPPGIPAHTLYLKVGAPIMLIRNLNSPKLCNGTRLQVRALHKYVIEATVSTGIGQGEAVFIPRIPLIPSDHPFQFKRLQFPIRVCYAMTINKAQGQSLKVAGVDLRTDCFSHGQLYVACSRVSSSDSLTILQPDKKTKNIVYREVLSI